LKGAVLVTGVQTCALPISIQTILALIATAMRKVARYRLPR